MYRHSPPYFSINPGKEQASGNCLFWIWLTASNTPVFLCVVTESLTFASAFWSRHKGLHHKCQNQDENHGWNRALYIHMKCILEWTIPHYIFIKNSLKGSWEKLEKQSLLFTGAEHLKLPLAFYRPLFLLGSRYSWNKKHLREMYRFVKGSDQPQTITSWGRTRGTLLHKDRSSSEKSPEWLDFCVLIWAECSRAGLLKISTKFYVHWEVISFVIMDTIFSFDLKYTGLLFPYPL